MLVFRKTFILTEFCQCAFIIMQALSFGGVRKEKLQPHSTTWASSFKNVASSTCYIFKAVVVYFPAFTHCHKRMDTDMSNCADCP